MKYTLQGLRSSGKEVEYDLEDKNQSIFEYECLTTVCDYVALYENNNGRLNQIKLFYKN